MQDIHSIGGGRFFAGDGGGSGGGGDRRLRPQHHHQHHHQQTPAALKCPRCDSLNTKFCYYNNYNLSQPRHFCKNCRRYWTKGGVLRNVPVGGGCRKTKRSKSKPAPASAAKSSNSHSSSESSTLTAGPLSEPPAAAPREATPAPNSADAGLLSGEIGSFTSLMAASSGGGSMAFEYGSILNQHDQGNHHQVDQTAEIELSALEERSNGFGSLGDWQQCGDQGLFDLTTTVDQAYWSQSQWNDPTLYLP